MRSLRCCLSLPRVSLRFYNHRKIRLNFLLENSPEKLQNLELNKICRDTQHSKHVLVSSHNTLGQHTREVERRVQGHIFPSDQ